MGLFNFFRRGAPEAASTAMVHAMAGDGETFAGFDDPAFKEFMRSRGGTATASGASINPKSAMKNTTVLRCVSLISRSIGMLPFHIRNRETKEKAKDHPLFRLIYRKPNDWQNAFQFRVMMQQNALVYGNAYALIVRSGARIIQLAPLANEKVEVRQLDNWSLEYTVNGRRIPAKDILHLREPLTEDGFTGISRVRKAAEAIGLAIQTERAAARLFQDGMVVGGALKHSGKLSPEAYERLQASLAARQGAGNAHRWMVLEEGMDLAPGGMSGRDSEATAQRQMQIAEIARAFDVPRPLLMMDDTSWGTGVDVLGQMFVQYGLNPWFECWEQAVECTLMSDADAETFEAKFNPGALLRGNMASQAEFWAKALGAGGQQPWAQPEEARDAFDWPAVDRESLAPQMGQQQTGGRNEPAQTS